jgi:hypothetical protein
MLAKSPQDFAAALDYSWIYLVFSSKGLRVTRELVPVLLMAF